MRLKLVTAPTSEPVSVEDLKTHAVIDTSSDDDLLADMIGIAREQVEEETGRALMTQTWALTLDRFPPIIYAPKPPLSSVSSITYVDTAGETQTWSSDEYLVDASSHHKPGRITTAYGYSYPSVRSQPGAVTVTFIAGYGAAGDVPKQLKQAIMLLVGAMYEHREASAYLYAGADIRPVGGPTAYDRIIGKYRTSWA